MTNNSNQLSVYLIVFLNAATHIMLIWRLRLERTTKLKFSGLAVGIPVAVMMTMRLMVGVGLVHGRVAEQVGIERFLTVLASILLVAGPFVATGTAVVYRRKQRSALAEQAAAS